MSKITHEQSREIYELASSPKNKLSNIALGKKFGISELAVRYHIKKWESKLHEISKTNVKIARAIANHTVDVCGEAVSIISAVKAAIQDAKSSGVSPEKLAPLYSNWIKSLELASELLGDLDRSPTINIQVYQQFNDFMKIILKEVNDADRVRIIEKLRQKAIY